MNALRRWDVELSCKGYYGFGGGYAKMQGFEYEGDAVYCNVCPMADTCWGEHKRRCAEVLPELVAEFERRAEAKRGPEDWFKQFDVADPYTAIMAGNLEDGMAVALTGEPKDRGPFTLSWPLTKRDDREEREGHRDAE